MTSKIFVFFLLRSLQDFFHTVHGVLKARILKWFVIPFSSGPRFVKSPYFVRTFELWCWRKLESPSDCKFKPANP